MSEPSGESSGGPNGRDLSAFSLQDLFRSEAEVQAQILSNGLLALERDGVEPAAINDLMRAAHSIKGAAAIVDLPEVVLLAHAMEDAFVAAQQGSFHMSRGAIDLLLQAVDLLVQIAALSDLAAPDWFAANGARMRTLSELIASADAAEPDVLSSAREDRTASSTSAPVALMAATNAQLPAASATAAGVAPQAATGRHEQSLKVGVEHLDRLLALTSASMVSAHMLQPFLQSMQRFKKRQVELFSLIDDLQQTLATTNAAPVLKEKALAIMLAAAPMKQQLVERLVELETHERSLVSVAQTTLDEVLALRMRPLKDGVKALPRMVRDLAHQLGKEVRLEIDGENTLIDRDILARIETPLNHLLRNALDHGMEMPQQREDAGKPRIGTLRISARHAGGMLQLDVSDDGRGVDCEHIRRRVVERGMVIEAMAAALSEAELLAFLFLPAFSLKDEANLISGRGVGLDVVHDAVHQQNGTVRIESIPGAGFKTCIVLPLTQSVVRSLVVTIGGQAYALPIAKIDRIVMLATDAIHTLENKLFFHFDGEHVGLVDTAQVLGLAAGTRAPGAMPLIVLSSGGHRHALVVDAIVGEVSLAVQPLEAIFGKLRDIAAGAILDNGAPVLILDVADLFLSIDKALADGRLQKLHGAAPVAKRISKRVLVVDDSMTVREMERNLLLARGFEVDVAVDGVDGWNAVRSKHYDLMITDVDMPRMDGIELVMLVRKDLRLRALPVMIVSYKDRPEDRARGVQAGADYYLTKGSFHDETLLTAVVDMIGEGTA